MKLIFHVPLVLALVGLGCGDDGTSVGDDGSVTTRDGGGGGRDGGGDPVDGGGGGGRDGGGGRTDAGPPDPACALPAPIDDGVTYERTLYVSAGASGGDGSMGSPFGTIDAAIRAATPGTRVLVGAGTYGPLSIDGVAGEAGRPIAIVADGDVTLEARGAGAVIAGSDAAYLVIQGFTLTGAGIHGMNIDDGGSYDTPAHHLVLRDITIASAGSGGNNDCIKMSGVDDFWVLASDIAGCNQGEAIDMVGCHRGVISGNYFHDTVGSGVQAKGGSSDTIIHGNRFENIPVRAVNAGGSTGLEYFRPSDATWEGLRIRVVANTFTRGGEMGAPIAFDACDDCAFVNNTVVDPQRWVVRILQGATDPRFVPSRNGLVANNVFVVQSSSIRAYFNVGPNTAPETFTFANNLWYARDLASWGGPPYTDGIPAGVDEIVQMDPQMVGGGDYHLMDGSPAQGAGRALPFSLPYDYDGRCYADPPTLGAFEIP